MSLQAGIQNAGCWRLFASLILRAAFSRSTRFALVRLLPGLKFMRIPIRTAFVAAPIRNGLRAGNHQGAAFRVASAECAPFPCGAFRQPERAGFAGAFVNCPKAATGRFECACVAFRACYVGRRQVGMGASVLHRLLSSSDSQSMQPVVTGCIWGLTPPVHLRPWR